jgi:hypothetical protein
MLSRFTEFLFKAHAAGLGHDAVIEIMIALLGVMVMVLTLVVVVITVGVAIIGVFGYSAIKEEMRKSAEKEAYTIATGIAERTMREYSERAQASGLSESQAEVAPAVPTKRETGKKKATSDKGLNRG